MMTRTFMKTYKNTRLGIVWTDWISVACFTVLFLLSFWAYQSYISVSDKFNIAKTKVDFIIQAPSTEQVKQIGQFSHIDKIVPYYYKSIPLPLRKGDYLSKLYIIDDEQDIPYTVFSDKLSVQFKPSLHGNKLYISDDIAQKSGWRAGDSVSLNLWEKTVNFYVSGIYKNDKRDVGGVLMAVKSPEVLLPEYTGAFVASNNLSQSASYFKKEYEPMGNKHFRGKGELVITHDLVQDLSKRYGKELQRNLAGYISFLLISYCTLCLFVSRRAYAYLKKYVYEDLKDNFTVAQEIDMYNRYFFKVFMLVLLIHVLVALFYNIKYASFWNSFLIISMILAIVSISGMAGYWNRRLKKQCSEWQKTIKHKQ
jgi:hypothetical protein